MDNQQIFNMIVSIAGFLAVYVFNSTTKQIQRLEDKLNELPKEYVAKDDYRSDITEIKDILKQIFNKLDSKADKSWEKIVTNQLTHHGATWRIGVTIHVLEITLDMVLLAWRMYLIGKATTSFLKM